MRTAQVGVSFVTRLAPDEDEPPTTWKPSATKRRSPQMDDDAFKSVMEHYSKETNEERFFKERMITKCQISEIGGFALIDIDGHVHVITTWAMPQDPAVIVNFFGTRAIWTRSFDTTVDMSEAETVAGRRPRL